MFLKNYLKKKSYLYLGAQREMEVGSLRAQKEKRNMTDKAEGLAAEITHSESHAIVHRVRHEVPAPKAPSQYTIQVNRLLKPTYPRWFKDKEGVLENILMHPRLERTGPAQYDFKADVLECFHKDQKNGAVDARIVYNYLEDSKVISACLNYQDAIAIERKGLETFPAVFHKFFEDKTLLFWGSIVENRNTFKLYVPCLSVKDSKLKLDWYPLESKCSASNPALYFK